MRRKSLAVVVATIVAAIAIAAIAFGPAGLRNLSNPNEPGNGTGTQPTAFDAPTWHVGDSWTYDVNTSSRAMQVDGPAASGHLTRTVVSASATQYNVSLDGSFQVRWMIEPTPMADPSGASAMLFCRSMLENATVDGYSLYRAPDLALLKEVRTLTVHGSSTTDAGTYDASYSATVETTFDPALDVWSFPLKANETWTAASNATIHGWIKWQLSGPHSSWTDTTNFTYTVPVRLVLRSGEAMDLSTPAGTFLSIPVSLGRPERDLTMGGMAPEPVDRAMGLDHEIPVQRNHAMQAWLSGTAKNVVRVQFFAAGLALNLVLSSYHLG